MDPMERMRRIAIASAAALLLAAAGCGGDTEYAEETQTRATVETDEQSIQVETTTYLQERSGSLHDALAQLKADVQAAGSNASQQTRDTLSALERQLAQADEQLARLEQQAQASGDTAWNTTKNAVEAAYTEIENGLEEVRVQLGNS